MNMNMMNNLPVLKPITVNENVKKETKKSDKELERLRKVKERVIRNRASANASRLKKKMYMELLEKKNKELNKEKDNLNNEVSKLQLENMNLKLQMEYLNQTVKKLSDIIYSQSNQQILNQNVQMLNIAPNNAYLSPIQEQNYNIPECEEMTSGNIYNNNNNNNNLFPQQIIHKNNEIVQENIIPENYLSVYSPQSSVGEPAALTNENSLQRTLFSQRVTPQMLTAMIYMNLSVAYVMMTLSLIPQVILYHYHNMMIKNRIQYKTYVISKRMNLCQTHLLPKFNTTKTKEIYSRFWTG